METKEDDFINQEGKDQGDNQPRKKKNTRKQKEQANTTSMYSSQKAFMAAEEQNQESSDDEVFGKKKKKNNKQKDDKKNARQKGKKNKKQTQEEDDQQDEETKETTANQNDDEETKEDQSNDVEQVEKEVSYPLTVVYCKNCLIPPEFCSYNKKVDLTQCKAWLKQEHPDLHDEIYPPAPEEETKEGEESKQDQKPAKKKKKVGFAAQDDVKKTIRINKLKRGGNKIISEIYGFDLFGGNLKDIAKVFGKKCACGAAAVTLNGEDCIQVQGDVEDRIYDLLEQDFASLNISADAIEINDAGNKKGRKRK